MIKMIKGDFHVVEYLGWETTYTEVSKPCSRLEPKLIPKLKGVGFALPHTYKMVFLIDCAYRET